MVGYCRFLKARKGSSNLDFENLKNIFESLLGNEKGTE